MASSPSKRGREDVEGRLRHVLDFPQRYMDSLAAYDSRHGAALCARLQEQLCSGRVVLTTSYSGIGAPETATSMLAGHVSGQVHLYSACDVMPAAQRALLLNPGLTGSSGSASHGHVFGNILDRLPTQVRQECVHLQDCKIKAWKELKKRGEGTSAMKDSLGAELHNELCRILDAVEFEQEAFCLAHNVKCPLNLRLVEEFVDSFHIEVAGTTCKAWSAFGSGEGWLHESTLPCLVWAYSTRFYEPDAVIHENGPRFDEDRLCRILGGERRRHRKGPHPRNMFGPRSGVASYVHHCEVFCPTNLGLPSRRKRKYTIFLNAQAAALTPNISIRSLFGREQLIANASIYLQAPSTQIQQKALQLMSFAGFAEFADGVDNAEEAPEFPQAAAFLPSVWQDLEAWFAIAKEKGFTTQDGSIAEGVPICLVNLAQRTSYMSQLDTQSAPTLLCGSRLFDLKTFRLLEMFPECFLVNGYPAPGPLVPEHLARHFPFPPSRFSESELRGFVGNGMHLSAVGASLAYVLATAVVRPGHASASN